jgi:NADPH oxidase 2
MIKPDTPPFCSQIGVFWKYWLVGGMVYLVERLLREVRGTHKTYISKVIQHPSRVCEIQIRKENFKPKAGQYIFLCCPEISLWQYHPFTLTSAPEEEYISVHIRCVGDFTNGLAQKLGCDFSQKVKKASNRVSKVVGVDRQDTTEYDPGVDRILPRGTYMFGQC